MKRQTWAEIKAQVKPETLTRIDTEASRLSGELHLAQLREPEFHWRSPRDLRMGRGPDQLGEDATAET